MRFCCKAPPGPGLQQNLMETTGPIRAERSRARSCAPAEPGEAP
jgi:hypothetical protein